MESNSKTRARVYITLLIFFACLSIVIIAVFSTLSLRRYDNQVNFASELSESIAYIQEAQLLFEKMGSSQKNILLYSGEAEPLDQLKATLSESREIIIKDLENYRFISQMFSPYQEADAINNLLSLLDDYYIYVMKVWERGMINDTYAVKELITEIKPMASEISDRFSELIMLNKNRTMEIWHKTSYYNNQSIMIIITLCVSVVILIFIASIVIMRKVTNVFSDNKEEVTNLPHQHSYNLPPNDTAFVLELERCVTDLKAITYDLSKTAKEIKR